MGRVEAVSGIASTLFGSVQLRVLTMLFAGPDRDFSLSEIVRATGAGSGAVQRELSRLLSSGLVSDARIGNQRRFRANAESPIFDELRSVIRKTTGLVAPLVEALEPLRSRIAAAFVFGSAARGDDTARSDIDLMVIADDLSYADLLSAVQVAEAKLARTVNPTLMSRDEWAGKVDRKSAFAARVAAQPKLFVIGTENGLRAG